MSIKSLFLQLKTLLETETSFKKRVSVWDYSILDVGAPYAIILKPGPVAQEMDAYGNQWLRQVHMIAEVHAFYQPAKATASVNKLLDAIGLIDTLLIDNYHLGLTVAEVRSARIMNVGQMDTVSRGEGANKWFHVTMVIVVTEPEVGSGSAQ